MKYNNRFKPVYRQMREYSYAEVIYIIDIIERDMKRFTDNVGYVPNAIYMNCKTFRDLRLALNMTRTKKGTYKRTCVSYNEGLLFGMKIKINENMRDNVIEIRKEVNCMPSIDSLDAVRYFTNAYVPKIDNPINLPTKYILNQDACILFWDDGDKTVVKRAKDDEQDPVKGFLWAYFIKNSGLSRTKANKYLREIDEAYEEAIHE